MATSEILKNSREVLYGENGEDHVTLESMHQLLMGIHGQLATMEGRLTKIDNTTDKLKATIENLVLDVGNLKTQVGNIETVTGNLERKSDKIENEMKTLSTNHNTLERNVENLKREVRGNQSHLEGLSNIFDGYKEKQDANAKEISKNKTSVSKVANDLEDHAAELREEIRSALSDVREENAELKNDILDLKCRSMKNNLIFTGLRESENENTESLLRQFIKTELNIHQRIEFGNVHRFGNGAKPGKKGRPRAIIARFIYHNDLAYVLSNAHRLKGKPFGIRQQFPEAIEQARMTLYPIMKQKRAEGHRVKLVRDILYVDGLVYHDHDQEDVTERQTRNFASGYTTPNRRPDTNGKRKRLSFTPRS